MEVTQDRPEGAGIIFGEWASKMPIAESWLAYTLRNLNDLASPMCATYGYRRLTVLLLRQGCKVNAKGPVH